jgi:phage-related protein
MNVLYFPNVVAFIKALESPLGARTNKALDLLKDRGHALRMPFSRYVEDGIFELRVVGAIQIRLLYFFHEGHAVVVHALFKKTGQLNRKDIAYALRARKAFIA